MCGNTQPCELALTVSDRRLRLTTQNTFRFQAFENGWTPLPSVDKACRFGGWEHVEVTRDSLTRWSTMLRYATATGLRVEPGMLVIDIDVRHLAASTACRSLVEQMAPGALWRIGDAPKIAAFLRYDGEPFTCRRTRRWLDGEQHHRVEVFGGRRSSSGGASRQFGAFGAHTVVDGAVVLEYRWDGADPAAVRLDSLPALDREQTYALVDGFDGILAGQGWSPELTAKAGEIEPADAWDLDESSRFDDNLGNDGIDLETLIANYNQRKRQGYDYRCSSSFAYPGHNRSKCHVGWSQRGRGGHITVHDYETCTTHRPRAAAPVELNHYAKVFHRQVGGSAIFDEAAPAERRHRPLEKASDDPEHNLQIAVLWLLEEFAFIHKSNSLAVPIWPGGGMPSPISGLRQVLKPYELVDFSTKPPKLINPVDVWLAQPDRIAIEDDRYRPELLRPLFDADGLLYRNIYMPAVHPATGGRTEAFHVFLRALIPDNEERAWFLLWLAHKVRFPWVPMVALIMVSGAAVQGSGRGTLAGVILARLLGVHNYQTVEFAELTGRHGRSRFNASLAERLLIFVNEASQPEESVTVALRNNAYEMIKVSVDPDGSVMRQFEAKFRMPFSAPSAASILIATNNLDAIKLPKEDRRFEVISNRDTEMSPAEVKAIRDWADDPANVGALHRELLATDLSLFNPYKAVGFAPKEEMIEAGRTLLERVADTVLEAFEGDVFTIDIAVEMLRFLQNGNRKFSGPVGRKPRWELPGGAAGIVERLIRQRATAVRDSRNKLVRVRYTLDGEAHSKVTLFARNAQAAAVFRGLDPQIYKLSLARSLRKIDGKSPLSSVDDLNDGSEADFDCGTDKNKE